MSLVAVPETSIQELKSDYTGKSAIIDALLTRYAQLERDAQVLRTRCYSEDLVYETAAGIRLAHPLISAIAVLERLMHYTLRELAFSVRMYDAGSSAAEDSVDTFLASLNAQHRPHHAMNRPIDAQSS